LAIGWRWEERPLWAKVMEPNRLSEENSFFAKHIAERIEEGIATVAEAERLPVASPPAGADA
jgi:hypothetical protein